MKTPSTGEKGKMSKYIHHELTAHYGSNESCEIILVTPMETGESYIRLTMSYSKRYKTNELDKAQEDMEALTGAGYINDIERLVKLRHIDVGLEHHREENA